MGWRGEGEERRWDRKDSRFHAGLRKKRGKTGFHLAEKRQFGAELESKQSRELLKHFWAFEFWKSF